MTIIWVVVFLILCKGLRSFGNAVFLLILLPLVALAVVICKLLYIVDPVKLQVNKGGILEVSDGTFKLSSTGQNLLKFGRVHRLSF